ncbi:MAG: aldolase/citrate lyase family protein [Clostridia bacterium]
MEEGNKTLAVRKSRVLDKLRRGEVACSIKINVSGPEACEIATLAGFDCVWTCMEHVPQTYADVRGQAMVCKAHDVDLMVRIPRGSYSDYIRPFEMDATGIMVPHILSAQDARDVVQKTRFYPEGRRPLDGGNADGRYCMLPMADYLRDSNREKMVVLQIEDPEPMAELEAICDMPGYDVLFFGPGDFSHATGHALDLFHPDVVAARKRIAKTARKYGKALGTVCVGDTRELLDEGYRLLNVGSDVAALSQYYKRQHADFAALLQECGL